MNEIIEEKVDNVTQKEDSRTPAKRYNILQAKFFWYARNGFNLAIASVRILIYSIRHPKKIKSFLFSFFSMINEFYQNTHGNLLPFESTQTFKEIQQKKVFCLCNYFNSDHRVMRPIETQILTSLIKYLEPKATFEIGTYNGLTAYHFALNTSLESKIYTLDLPPDYDLVKENKNKLAEYSYDDLLVVQLSKESINRRMYRNTPYASKIIELFGDSMTFDFSPYYKKIDVVFIDGSHAFECVKSDTQNAFELLSPKGVIIWHDFDYIIHRDVFKYLNSLSKHRRIYSIAQTRFAVYGNCL